MQRKEVARLRISSDGMLNLVPFGALADARAPSLIQHFVISRLGGSRSNKCFHRRGASAVVAVSPSKPKSAHAVASGGAFRAEILERLEDAEAEAPM